MKTWRCFSPFWPEVTCEITAESRGKALYKYWMMGREAGYDLDYKALRARLITEGAKDATT